MSINWEDPSARFHLADRVRARRIQPAVHTAHADSTVAFVNGYGIRPVMSRFGRIYMIDGASIGFRTLDQSKAHAATLPTKEQVNAR